MKRFIALTTVVAALGVGATSATAAPPTAGEQIQKLCQRQGSGPAFGLSCTRFLEGFSDRELSHAEKLCDRVGGDFSSGFDGPVAYWDCPIL